MKNPLPICTLVCALESAKCNQPIDMAAIRRAYGEFIDSMSVLSEGPCSPELMRTLDRARIELETLQNELPTGAMQICMKSLEAIRCELRILRLRITHPHFDAAKMENKCQVISPLYLSDQFTITDITELITAFYLLRVLRTENGEPASLNLIIKVFERLLNIKLKNYAAIRICVLNRKIHITRFLDRMRDAIVERSQR